MASRGLGTLTLDLVARIGGFTGPLDQAERTAKKRAESITKGFERMSLAIGTAVGIAVTAISGAFVVGVKSAINSMDDLSKAAQRVQMPTEEFSQLAYAGSLADVSMQDLTSSMGRLAKAQADAQRETSTQARIFDALDISLKNADGSLRDTYEIFLDFADAFEEQKGSPEILAAGMQIFGRSFQNLIPLLKDGRSGLEAAADEADRLGITLSTEAGQAAEEFNDNLTRLQTATQGLWRAIAAELLPDLIQLTNNLTQMAQEGNVVKDVVSAVRFVADDLATSFQKLKLFIKDITDFFGGLRDGALATKDVLVGIATLNWDAAREAFRRGVEADKRVMQGLFGNKAAASSAAPQADIIDLMMRPLDSGSNTRLTAAFGDVPKSGGSKKSGGKSEAEKEAENLERAYKSMNDRLKESIALFGQEGEAAKLRYELEFGEMAKLDPLKKEELLQRAEKIDLMREEAEVQEELDRLNEQVAESVERILEDLEFERQLLGKTAEQQEIMNLLRWAGVEANTAYVQSIIESAEALQQQGEAMGDQIEVMDTFRRETSDALQDVIRGTKSLKDAFTDMLDNIIDKLVEMMVNRYIEQAFGQMGTNQAGTSGGWLAQAAGLFFGGGRAAGGHVGAGMFYRVNETRPELLSVGGRDYLMMGSKAGHVSPNDRGMPRGDQTLVVNVTGTVDRRSIDQIAQEQRRLQLSAAVRNG